jgi:hypothetical protein
MAVGNQGSSGNIGFAINPHDALNADEPWTYGMQYNPLTGQWEPGSGSQSTGGGALPLNIGSTTPAATSPLVPDATAGLGGVGTGDAVTGVGAGVTAGAGDAAAGSGLGGVLGSGLTTSQGLQGILGLYSAYLASQKHPLQQVPFTPAQLAIQNAELGFINNSPTRNFLGNMLGQNLAAHNNEQFHLPPGANGYVPLTGQSDAPKYDLSTLMKLLGASTTNNTQPAGTTTPTPTSPATNPLDPRTPPFKTTGNDIVGGVSAPSSYSPGTATPPPAAPPLQNATLTPAETAAFLAHVQTHGVSGGHAVANAVSQYPQLGVHGAIALHKMMAGQGYYDGGAGV